MSKDTKKVEKKIEKTKQKPKSSELSEKDLEQVAGGVQSRLAFGREKLKGTSKTS